MNRGNAVSQIKLIVGLANPGAKYEGTRHNAGEWLVNELARMYNTSLKDEAKYFGKTAKINTVNGDVWLLIPTTFMNLSGKAVGALAHFFRIKAEEILIAHDELDLPPGVAKLKQGGGHGGHNGLKDIISALGNNNNFYRIRLGIGHPGHKDQVAGYVLSKPAPQDQQKINAVIDEASRCLEILFKDGVTSATNRLNSFKA
ncbi:peptidyl-tRNA hydrolase [[Haemophilus] ducreyi 35000HP]|nr:peptidyl-tRNA hydrolase [[Haemophilus] ducreyi 35000HP]